MALQLLKPGSNGHFSIMTATEYISVLIVDDHSIMRKGLRLIIEENHGLVVIGEASNREDSLALAASEQPNIIGLSHLDE